MKPFHLVASFALVASLASAQLSVSLTGRVERLPAPGCNPDATHRVACTQILLRSTAVNLGDFEGRVVDLEATQKGGLGCTSLLVTAAANAAASTSTASLGGYRLGSTVLITTVAPVGAVVAYFFSAEPFFLPFGDFGTLQLSPFAGFLYWTADLSIGVALRPVRIPDDAGLVGQVALFQTAFVSVAPQLQARLLNDSCFEIRAR